MPHCVGAPNPPTHLPPLPPPPTSSNRRLTRRRRRRRCAASLVARDGSGRRPRRGRRRRQRGGGGAQLQSRSREPEPAPPVGPRGAYACVREPGAVEAALDHLLAADPRLGPLVDAHGYAAPKHAPCCFRARADDSIPAAERQGGSDNIRPILRRGGSRRRRTLSSGRRRWRLHGHLGARRCSRALTGARSGNARARAARVRPVCAEG